MTANQQIYSMQKAALLVGEGANNLFKKLRMAGVLYESKNLRNLPKEKYIRAGLFTTQFKMCLHGDSPSIHEKTVATPAGLNFIRELLRSTSHTAPSVLMPKQNTALGNKTLCMLKASLVA